MFLQSKKLLYQKKQSSHPTITQFNNQLKNY